MILQLPERIHHSGVLREWCVRHCLRRASFKVGRLETCAFSSASNALTSLYEQTATRPALVTQGHDFSEEEWVGGFEGGSVREKKTSSPKHRAAYLRATFARTFT